MGNNLFYNVKNFVVNGCDFGLLFLDERDKLDLDGVKALTPLVFRDVESQELAEKILVHEGADGGVSDLGVSSVEKPFYFVDNPKKESVYIGLNNEILESELHAQYYLRAKDQRELKLNAVGNNTHVIELRKQKDLENSSKMLSSLYYHLATWSYPFTVDPSHSLINKVIKLYPKFIFINNTDCLLTITNTDLLPTAPHLSLLLIPPSSRKKMCLFKSPEIHDHSRHNPLFRISIYDPNSNDTFSSLTDLNLLSKKTHLFHIKSPKTHFKKLVSVKLES